MVVSRRVNGPQNPQPANASECLSNLSGPLTALRKVAERFVGDETSIDEISDAVCLSPRPRIGPKAYALELFPGLSDDTLESYEAIHAIIIPEFYRNLLRQLNGAHLFELSLFGIPPSMAERPPLLDRSTSWPLDIGSAQMHWRNRYPASPDDFFFGSGPYARDERLGYFLWVNGGVEALRMNGEQFGEWADFNAFLADELARVEGLYGQYEQRMEETLRRVERAESSWRRWLPWR